MSESIADVEDWSLQAIVRGWSGDFAMINGDTGIDGQAPFPDALTGFPDMFDYSAGSSEKLGELYKPFYEAGRDPLELLPAQTVIDFQGQPKPDGSAEEAERLARDEPCSDQSSGNSLDARVTAGYIPKYKKRKNQHKRVVVQVSAEGLSADKWAWRKYGQKPIKGTPYPRSYYRCSSSKACLARKQVEQSCSDPGLFILTYTAEHNHSQPTRRNSLAGTVRQKFPSHNKNPNDSRTNNNALSQKNKESCSSTNTPPRVLPEKSIGGFHASIKKENNIENNEMGGDYSNEVFMSDYVMDDDFFSGFEDLDDGFSTLEPHQCNFLVRECGWF